MLRVYIDHYKRQRPKRALEFQPPSLDEPTAQSTVSEIRRRERLGGLVHEYYLAAA